MAMRDLGAGRAVCVPALPERGVHQGGGRHGPLGIRVSHAGAQLRSTCALAPVGPQLSRATPLCGSHPIVAHDVSCHLITTPRKPRLSLFTTLLFRLTKPDPF